MLFVSLLKPQTHPGTHLSHLVLTDKQFELTIMRNADQITATRAATTAKRLAMVLFISRERVSGVVEHTLLGLRHLNDYENGAVAKECSKNNCAEWLRNVCEACESCIYNSMQ